MGRDWWTGAPFGLLLAGVAFLGNLGSAFLLGDPVGMLIDEITIAAGFISAAVLGKHREPESGVSAWFDPRLGIVVFAVFVSVLLVDITL